MVRALLLSALLWSGPSPFTIVNGTGVALDRVELRLAARDGPWRPLAFVGLGPGAGSQVPSLGGEDCAYDVRATAGGTVLTWPGVNLCDVKVVTLNRRADGTLWVDYD